MGSLFLVSDTNRAFLDEIGIFRDYLNLTDWSFDSTQIKAPTVAEMGHHFSDGTRFSKVGDQWRVYNRRLPHNVYATTEAESRAIALVLLAKKGAVTFRKTSDRGC